MRSRTTAALVTGALAAALVMPASATAAPTAVASALTASGDLNLISYVNPVEDTPYSSPGDAFNVLARPAELPFAVADDSAGSFASDTQGIVGADDTDPFFAAVDTQNGDPLPGEVTATWTFDVSSASGPLFVNVDAAAMGDFEDAGDLYRFAIAVDGGPAETVTATIDESTDRLYVMESGTEVVLDDPANLLGAPLTNDFTTFSIPVDSTGSDLTVSFTADTNGGSEAFAFRNLTVSQNAPVITPVDEGPEPEPEPDSCDTLDEDLTLISEVQGFGGTSPLVGQTVTVRGIVTFSDEDLPGYFLQEEPADQDDSVATSEGIYVFDPRGDLPAVGQTVEITDEVEEFRRFGDSLPDTLTQFAFAPHEVCDATPLEIDPTPLPLPLPRQAGDPTALDREGLESMLVTTTQSLDVTGLFSVFGEIGVTSMEAPLIQPTSKIDPSDPAAAAALAAQEASLIKIDDRGEHTAERRPWAQPPSDIGPRPGDTIAAGVTGPLSYSFDDFKIQPSGDAFPTVVGRDENPRPPRPSLAGGNDIGAFNVLNYFNTFGDSAVLRGATTQDDFQLQTEKIVNAINTLDAAVLGLVELENDYEDLYDTDASTEASIVTLVEALNDDAGFVKWDFVAPPAHLLTSEGLGGGGLGTDAIAVGIIYQPDRAEPTGTPATFDIDALLDGDSENNRWPLAQSFDVEGPGPDVTVVVNHFKSKGSSCSDTAGPGYDFGDDAGSALLGNCDLTRQYATERLLEWLDGRPTGVDHDRNLVTGDLNAYQEEKPIRILEDAGYTDLIEELGGDAFTYKFDGRYGRLDHAMASPDLRRFVRDAAVWQANSLEHYNNLYDVAPVDTTAYASSDHDPVVVALDAPGRSRAFGDDGETHPDRGNGRVR